MEANMTTPTETAAELRRQIQFHDHRYYNLQDPMVSDAEYDNLMEQLRRLEKEHPEIRDPDSPTRRVGGTVGSGFAQVEHPEPMLSLANAASREEFNEWHLRTARHLGTGEFTMSAEPKIDGLAVRLVYHNGRLVQGVTRGNGASGEDVTHNVRTVRNLPLTLRTAPGGSPPEILEVRERYTCPEASLRTRTGNGEEQGESTVLQPQERRLGHPAPAGPGPRLQTRAQGLDLLQPESTDQQPPDVPDGPRRAGAAGKPTEPGVLERAGCGDVSPGDAEPPGETWTTRSTASW